MNIEDLKTQIESTIYLKSIWTPEVLDMLNGYVLQRKITNKSVMHNFKKALAEAGIPIHINVVVYSEFTAHCYRHELRSIASRNTANNIGYNELTTCLDIDEYLQKLMSLEKSKKYIISTYYGEY